MNSVEIEYNVINMLCIGQSFKRLTEDTEIIIISPDTAEVNNLNTDDLMLAKSEINFFTVKLDIENHSMKLELKEPYKNFDNLSYVNSSALYRELYGNNLDNHLKLMIAFLYTIDNPKLRKSFIKKLNPEHKTKINYYLGN